VVYPSALSLPFYMAYIASVGAWSLDLFSGEANRRFHANWETRLATLGTLYCFLYLLAIYLFQVRRGPTAETVTPHGTWHAAARLPFT
jgi:hypothetical protein